MVRIISVIAIVGRLASADSIVEQDLLARMYQSFDALRHAENRDEAERQKDPIRLRLEKALAIDDVTDNRTIRALLFVPPVAERAAPAIILDRPHEDPMSQTNLALARDLAQAGFIVLAPDLRAHHDMVDLLATGGLLPETLLQRDIRAMLDFLSRQDYVDRGRIAVVGSGFSAALAVALNARVAVALLDALPNLREELDRMTLLAAPAQLDPCYVVYGLLRFASTEDLGTLITPRPLLVTNPAPSVADYLSALYQSYGALETLRQITCASSYCSQVGREWLVERLGNNRRNQGELQPTPVNVESRSIDIPVPGRQGPIMKKPLTTENLRSLLGEPLPDARNAWLLKATPQPQEVALTTQPGFVVPSTVLRPGVAGGDPANGELLALFDAGRQSVLNDEIVQAALRRGWFVWAMDVRGLGSLKAEREGFVFGASALLGENFGWRQSSDVSRTLETLASGSHTHRTALYARGRNATVIAAYVAATAERDRPEWIVFRDVAESFFNGSLQQYLIPINCFHLFDIKDLLQQSRPKLIMFRELDEIESYW